MHAGKYWYSDSNFQSLLTDSEPLVGGDAAKILIISKNGLNESCAKLNFLQKTQWKHNSIYSWNGTRGLQKCAVFEILTYNTLEWESRFTLGLNPAKNIDYIENCSNESCTKLNFLQKTQWKNISIYPKSGAWEIQRFVFLKYYLYNALK